MEKVYMSVEQALERYSIGKTMFYGIIKKYDNCPRIRRLGRKVLLPVAEFDKFMDSILA